MRVGSKEIKYLYVVTTQDEYELPIAVGDSVQEVSKMTGIPPKTISTSISLGRPYYYKIDVSDEIEDMYI